MKKVERLRGPRVLEAVRARGKVLDGRFLKFFYGFESGQGTPVGFGIVMGRRHGPAVTRNRLKRRIRAAFHEVLGPHTGALKEKRLSLLVVVLFKGLKGRPPDRVTYTEIRDDIACLAHVIHTFAADINGACADLSGA